VLTPLERIALLDQTFNRGDLEAILDFLKKGQHWSEPDSGRKVVAPLPVAIEKAGQHAMARL
jgi:hypothetical protein